MWTSTPDPVRASDRSDTIEEALERLAAYRYVDGPGMATHGPMGAEAMSALGHDALVPEWVEAYKTRHEVIPAPPSSGRLQPDDDASWRPALGDPSRLTDWEELYIRLLQDQPWSEVVGSWVPRLLPGYGGAFTHGLIRTAHAVRVLESVAVPSPSMLGELARGLAYWSGTYKALPGRPELRGSLPLDEALARVPRPDQPWSPIDAGQFTRLHELPGFAEAVESLGAPAADQALSQLTAAFARMMLANPDVHPFGFVHAVTPVAGARTLLPHLPSVTVSEVYAQLWQVNAAIAAGFGAAAREDGPDAAHDALPLGLAPAELVARAAEHRDPHVVKFTEAALRENAVRPDPAYLRAAQHVIDRTPPW